MVHQLSLVSTIPHSSYVQTVSTLQALTGLLSPQPIATYTLISKPHNVFKPKFEPGKVNQIEQYFMKCITTWTDETSGLLDISKPIIKDGENDNVLVDRLFIGEEAKRNWTLQISDIPIAGKNQVCCAQTIYESTLVHHHTKVMGVERVQVTGTDESAMDIDLDEKSGGDKKDNSTDGQQKPDKDGSKGCQSDKQDQGLEKKEKSKEIEIFNRKDSFLQFLEDLGYDVVNQYWIKGIRFFHGDIVIEIFKVFIRDDDSSNVSANDKIKLKLLDESNTFQIIVYLNIPKSTDVELINQGTKDLLRLKDFLKNLFKLEIPDRMYMDSRVTNN